MGAPVRCNDFLDATVEVLLWVGIAGIEDVAEYLESCIWADL